MVDPNKKFRFRKFRVYVDARIFATEIKKLARAKFPRYEQFNLLDQICRAVDSIILNTAEGSDRSTDKDFANFLNHSHTSLNEVVSCLDVAKDEKYIDDIDHFLYLNKAAELAGQITAFRSNILTNPTNNW